MGAPKLKLSTKHLAADIPKAADEALNNAVLLYAAGHFAHAREIALAMLQPGPWKVGKSGTLMQRLEDLVPFFSWLNDAASPAVGEQEAMDLPALTELAKETGDQELQLLTMPDRVQLKPAGQGWDKAIEDEDLVTDLLWILKDRANARIEASRAGMEALMAAVMGGMGGIQVAPEARHIEDERLAAALEAHGRRNKLYSYMDSRCWNLLAALALAQGKTDVAARYMSTAIALGEELWGLLTIRYWAPWRAMVASGALAPAIGIDGRAAEAYMQAFRGRAQLPPRQATSFSWKEALKEFKARHEGEDTTRRGASAKALEALQERVGEPLPPSYLEFLKASDGLAIPEGMVNLLPAAKVEWFAKDNAGWIQAWNSNAAEPVPDEQYFTYGPDQDCVWLRPEYLKTALQVSDAREGDVYLLNPKIRFGDEWEAWFFGNSNPGAVRYRSFAELMRAQVFEREEE